MHHSSFCDVAVVISIEMLSSLPFEGVVIVVDGGVVMLFSCKRGRGRCCNCCDTTYHWYLK